MSRNKPTVRSIASDLGLSAMTVSRALNGHPGVNVDTRRQILDKVKTVGYDYHNSSRNYQDVRAKNVAIHCVDHKFDASDKYSFHANLYYQCVRRLKNNGLKGFLIDLEVCPEDKCREILQKCGALVLLSTLEASVFRRIRKTCPKLKVVSIFGDVEDTIHVCPDEYEGGRIAAEKLTKMGHRHVAVLTYLDEECYRKRFGGFLAGFRMSCPDSRVDLVEYQEHLTPDESYADRRKQLDRYFDEIDVLPSAFFVTNGWSAVFLADYFAERNWKIPDDFSLLAYDNLEVFKLTDPVFSRVWFSIKNLAIQVVYILQHFPMQWFSQQVLVEIPNQFSAGNSIKRMD